jgi:hypothetical protein
LHKTLNVLRIRTRRVLTSKFLISEHFFSQSLGLLEIRSVETLGKPVFLLVPAAYGAYHHRVFLPCRCTWATEWWHAGRSKMCTYCVRLVGVHMIKH